MELFENIRNTQTEGERKKHKRASCCLEETDYLSFYKALQKKKKTFGDILRKYTSTLI
jgi:hypothetical protein